MLLLLTIIMGYFRGKLDNIFCDGFSETKFITKLDEMPPKLKGRIAF